MQNQMTLNAVELPQQKTTFFAWVVFALTLGLMLSDYMSRQVLNVVFPMLKAEWALTDARLGILSSVVALTVGVLSFPLSLLADKIGRVRSVVIMALLWSLATLACGMAENYDHMLVARFVVGLGEAAYGSVGLAVILTVFPVRMRAGLTGAFMAGGMLGSVLGIGIGGVIAGKLGWRMAFNVMAVLGLVITVLFFALVREKKLKAYAEIDSALAEKKFQGSASIKNLVTNPLLLCLYAASGFQLLVSGALLSWLPSFFQRYYNLTTQQASGKAAILVLCSGAGMTLCGMVSDRYFAKNGGQIRIAIAYCLVSCALLLLGFNMAPGTGQMVVIALGMFVAAGTAGPTGALVTMMTHASIHATALATFTLANNLLGLAPGPYVAGVLADKFGLQTALNLIPLASVAAIVMYVMAHRLFQSGKFNVEKVSA